LKQEQPAFEKNAYVSPLTFKSGLGYRIQIGNLAIPLGIAGIGKEKEITGNTLICGSIPLQI
jgi:hypothetical protein